MNRFSFTLIALLLGSCIAIGCGHDDSLTVREGHLVKILYAEKPIGGVEVRLYRLPHIDGNEISYVGFSDTNGEAYLTSVGPNIPPIDSTPWGVAVLSDGDGSWMLDPKFNDPVKSGIELQFRASGSSTETAPIIRLPTGAVRSLTR